MKKLIITTALIASVAINTPNAYAESSTEENVGFFSGAVTGAAVGGPIGFIIGGVAGALLGEQVEKANELDTTVEKLNQQSVAYQQAKTELSELSQKVKVAHNELQTTNQWLTEGLTLDLLFSTNSDELAPKDEELLSKLATLLTKFPDLKVRLDGFADPRGAQDDNYQLSLSRANKVLAKLTEMGVSKGRILLQAHGENNATTIEPSADNYALERRVSIRFVAEQPSTVAQN